MSDVSHDIDREEVELLLPWYVNGTLEPAEHARVAAYLEAHPEMNSQLDTLYEDMHETIVANETIAGPSRAALDRLMASIEMEAPLMSKARAVHGGLMSKVEDFLQALSPGRLGWAAMAAAAVIVLQAGVIGTVMLKGTPESTYEVAGGGKSQASTRLLIQFKPDAGLSAVTAFLEKFDAQIIAGPKAGGIYDVRVGDKALTGAARDELVKQLSKDAGVVMLVLPSGG